MYMVNSGLSVIYIPNQTMDTKLIGGGNVMYRFRWLEPSYYFTTKLANCHIALAYSIFQGSDFLIL